MSSYSIPYVVQQTPRGERTLDLYSRLLSERIVYLGTEIDDGVANAVIAQLLHLASENPELPISLYLNSPGGSITAMLAVYDAMQHVGAPVERIVIEGGRAIGIETADPTATLSPERLDAAFGPGPSDLDIAVAQISLAVGAGTPRRLRLSRAA